MLRTRSLFQTHAHTLPSIYLSANSTRSLVAPGGTEQSYLKAAFAADVHRGSEMEDELFQHGD